MTNQSKESAAKQQKNLRTPPKRWFKIVDKKNMAKAANKGISNTAKKEAPGTSTHP